MEELKPCPFCGSKAVLDHSDGGSEGRVWMLARCSDIECQGHYFSRWLTTPKEAIEAWNTRYERTCHASDLYDNVFECSECGCMDTDGTRNYCPGCGARVVKE